MINKQIVIELQEKGIAAPSGTTLAGKYVIHVSLTNHRTNKADLDLLIHSVLQMGKSYLQQTSTK